jgi:hypothetical protein
MNDMSIEISLVPFRYKYLKALHDLLESNDYIGISSVNMKTLPKIGYIALMNGHPIAAGFLRRVEGGYAQLDTLTSNKYFGSQIRHAGIVKVVDALLEDTKDLQLNGVIAFTRDVSIIKRAEDLGFHVLSDQKLIAFSFK